MEEQGFGVELGVFGLRRTDGGLVGVLGWIWVLVDGRERLLGAYLQRGGKTLAKFSDASIYAGAWRACAVSRTEAKVKHAHVCTQHLIQPRSHRLRVTYDPRSVSGMLYQEAEQALVKKPRNLAKKAASFCRCRCRR